MTRAAGVAAGAVFALLSVLAIAGNRLLLTVDLPLSETIRGTSQTWLWGTVTHIGSTAAALATAGAVAVVSWRRCRRFTIVYPTTLLLGGALNNVLKQLIGRPRPADPATTVSLASFPSGHTLQATLLLGLLPLAVLIISSRRALSVWASITATAGIAAVGYSRVYLGAHWPTDVVGAILLGALLILGAHWLLTRPGAHDSCGCPLGARADTSRCAGQLSS